MFPERNRHCSRGVRLADEGGGEEFVADDDVELGGGAVDGDGAQVGEGAADQLTVEGAVAAGDDDALGGGVGDVELFG